MQIISIPPLLMMAISLYVCLYHLLFYTSNRTEVSNLFFSASCFSVAAYDFFCSLLYSSHSVTRSGFYQQGQFISLIFFTLFMLLYIRYLLGFKEKHELRLMRLFILALSVFLFVLIIYKPLIYSSKPHIIEVPFFNIIYTEIEIPKILYLLYILFFIIMAWASYVIAKYYRLGLKYLRPILIAIVLFFITGINDMLIPMDVISNLYLLEYGFFIFIIGTAVSLQNKYWDMHKKIQHMNRTLDDQVKLRTSELMKARDNLETANSEYRVLLQVLSHDLSNNLSSIISSVEMIEHHDAEFDEVKDFLNLSAKNALKLIEVVRSIRALEDKMLNLESVNINDALKDSFSIMKKKISSKDIKLDVQINGFLSVMVEKVTFINSVINNILSNAIKFSYPGSKIIIRAEKSGIQPGTGNNSCKVKLSFHDQGVGIPESELIKIFSLTETISRRGTEGEAGVGFGMPLIHRFVSLYGGKIEIESREISQNSENHGTTLTLILNSGI